MSLVLSEGFGFRVQFGSRFGSGPSFHGFWWASGAPVFRGIVIDTERHILLHVVFDSWWVFIKDV